MEREELEPAGDWRSMASWIDAASEPCTLVSGGRCGVVAAGAAASAAAAAAVVAAAAAASASAAAAASAEAAASDAAACWLASGVGDGSLVGN